MANNYQPITIPCTIEFRDWNRSGVFFREEVIPNPESDRKMRAIIGIDVNLSKPPVKFTEPVKKKKKYVENIPIDGLLGRVCSQDEIETRPPSSLQTSTASHRGL